jgi:hypothetical protein
MFVMTEGIAKKDNSVLQKLRRAMKKIDRPGAFCVSDDVPLVHPGLNVKGVGLIGLPLSASQARELKERCERAPYGRGEKTIVDEKVRHVWHMEASKLSFTNPEWSQALRRIVEKVQEELGLSKQGLESHLYDLLLYEPGCFFLPHRDGERLDRMVATLVITLPSAFKGGELVVRHGGEEQSIAPRGERDDLFNLHYAAFYADCEHEVRPLTEGYRLCLVYNLTLSKAGKKITAPSDTEHIGAIRELLREWSQTESAGKLVVTLDHQYTEQGLSWDTLKGVDRVKARVLCQAAQDTGCKAYLSLVTLHESGSAEEGDDGRGYYGRRRYGDLESNDADKYEMSEVFESTIDAENVVDQAGHGLPIGAIRIDEGDLLDPEALRGVVPETHFEGYTGNAGMTLDRWYRHAAIVLWPERLHFDVLCERRARAVVPLLAEMVAQWGQSGSASAEALKAQCIQFASTILSKWPKRHHAYRDDAHASAASQLLQALVGLGERGLIERYLAEVMIKDISADAGGGIVTACQEHGWRAFEDQLVAICQSKSLGAVERNVRLLEEMCTANPKTRKGHAQVCEVLAQEVVSALQSLDQDKGGVDWRWHDVDRGVLLARLIKSLLASNQTVLLERLLAHALALPTAYPLVSVHLKALEELRPWLHKSAHALSPPISRWLAACRKQLEALTALEPQEPTDFSRPATITCKCDRCKSLNRFLADPREEVHRIRAAQEVRRHVEDRIRAHECDVGCSTERRGSPHTLVCTKTKASFHRSLKEYHDHLGHLAKVLSIEASL